MSDQYYRFFPGDYLRDTQGLTLTENGAYRALLDSYYSNETLTDDIDELCIICRAYHDFERRAVEKVVAKYFSKNGNGHLVNRRADKEIEARREYIAEQTRKSKLGVEARKQKQPTGQPTGEPKGQPGVNPLSPSPSLKKEKNKSRDQASPTSQDRLVDKLHTQCKSVNSLPKKKEKFNPYQWIEWADKHRYHPEAVGRVLESLIAYWDNVGNPWSYASTVIAKESGNYYEKDATKSAVQEKNEWLDLVNRLKEVHGK